MSDSSLPNPVSSVASASFRDQARAQRELAGLKSRLPERTYAALLRLLTETPDPDQALSLMGRLVSEGDAQIAELLGSDHALLHYALLIFGHSHWLGETLLQNPDLLRSLPRDRNLERSLGRDDFLENLARFRARSGEADISLLLARFKKREYVRIVLRDVLGAATLAETTAEISALADVLIEEALRHAAAQMRERCGSPLHVDASGRHSEARFAVLSLGKLGGNELNYSSDIDLFYLYDAAETAGRISLREYFIRQAQLVTEILSRPTPEGALFRIDLRLRPQGQEGEPAVGLRQALNYYAHAAHDWELQALIKARHSAGDVDLAREFIRSVQPRVYVANVNFAAVETAANSRRKIGEHRRRSLALGREPATIDVKLDRGGIRDIEFLLQCLQRVYGGEEPWLRACGTLFSLQKLNDKSHLSSADFQELSVAYEFLRNIEHRLQLQRGQQLHRLPSSAAEIQVLARAVDRNHKDSAGSLIRSVRERMGRVAAIYERIIHNQKQREKGGAEAAADSYYVGARELSFDQVLQRLKSHSPALHRLISTTELGVHGRRNLHRFLGSAMAGGERYSALREHPEAIGRAIALFETSDYLAEALIRHPSMVRVLNDPDPDGVQSGAACEGAGLFSLDGLARDRAESLAMLRRTFRQTNFAAAAKDILWPRPAFASMKQSTQFADEAIRCALRIVNGERNLAVFALGRLGTEEFDIASDADLLFVRAPEADEEEARLDAERLVQALSAYTKEGSLFAVDARLRPHGGEGELVVSSAQLERYLAEEAQPWEALTYSKIRFVAGRKDVAALLLPLVWHQIVEAGRRKGFAAAVLDMRTRLEKSNRYPHSFKLAAGGFYDVDFVASCVMLRQADFLQGNTEERLERLHEAGLLATPVFERLRQAALLYRTTDHAIRLVTGRARPELPTAEHARQATEKMVGRILGGPLAKDLQAALLEIQSQVREIFLGMIAGLSAN
jgi:[glutamine synthetase] adenylyltransferase / [glutamine synthetase]-adenylyl-L-tyrosine phosphorylase